MKHQENENTSHRKSESKLFKNSLSNNCSMFLYIVLITLFICGLLFLYFFLKMNGNKSIVLLEDKDMIKPIVDKRIYKVIKLSNDLEVTLISDIHSEICGASFTIGLGYLQEDNDIEGFDHLLEHIIFSGSKKFKAKNFFESHLAMYFGQTNSFTEEEKMNFSFEVDWKGFEKGLEIFSMMFDEPLIDEQIDDVHSMGFSEETKENSDNNDIKARKKSLINNKEYNQFNMRKIKMYDNNGENNKNKKKRILQNQTSNSDLSQIKHELKNKDLINSVIEIIDEEFELSKQSDSWKENQILKILANPDHPYSKFSIGNNDSFKNVDQEKVKKRLRIVFEKYFTPKNMKLTLYSNQDIKNIQKLAEKHFKNIRLKSTLKDSEPRYLIIQEKLKAEIFQRKQLSKLVWYEKLPQGDVIDFIFPVREQLSRIYTKPYNYMSYYIKYSGENSLLQHLIKKNLAIKIDAGMIGNYRTFGLYAISITLTKDGLNDIEKLTSTVFQYINLIIKEKPSKEIYSDIQSISEAKFFFSDDYSRGLFNQDVQTSYDKGNIQDSNSSDGSKIMKQISKISMNMFDYNYKEIIINEFLHLSYDEKAILDFENELSINNCLIIMGSPNIPPYFLEKPTSSLTNDQNTNNKRKNNIQENNKGKYQNINKLNLKLSRQSQSTSLDKNYQLTLEPVYQTPYIKADIPKEWLKKYSSLSDVPLGETKLKPRERNLFITKETNIISCFGVGKIIDESNKTEFEKCKKEIYSIEPEGIIDRPNIKLFYKLDRTFYTPKVNMYFNIVPHVMRDADSSALIAIYSEYLIFTIKTELADIIDSGNEVYGEVNDNGIDIFLNVFTDLALNTYNKIISILFNSDFDSVLFDEILEYSKFKFNRNLNVIPFTQAPLIFNRILKINIPKSEKIQADFQKIVYGTFKELLEKIKKNLFIKIMVYGNLPKSDFYKLQFKIDSIMSKSGTVDLNEESNNLYNLPNELIKKYEYPTALKVHRALIGEYIYKVQKDGNQENMLAIYFQVGERTPMNFVYCELLELAWGNIFYYYLKTIKKLGYYISSLSREIDDVMYFEIIVQSPMKLDIIDNELNNVFEKIKKRVNFIDNKRLAFIKNKLHLTLSLKESSLRDRTERVWTEIYDGIYDFSFKEKCLEFLEKVTTEDLVDFYNLIFERSKNRLSIIYQDFNENAIKTKMDTLNTDNNEEKIYTSFLTGTEITDDNLSNYSISFVNKSITQIKISQKKEESNSSNNESSSLETKTNEIKSSRKFKNKRLDLKQKNENLTDKYYFESESYDKSTENKIASFLEAF